MEIETTFSAPTQRAENSTLPTVPDNIGSLPAALNANAVTSKPGGITAESAGNSRIPQLLPSAHVRIATWSPAWEQKVLDLLLPLPRALGYKNMDVPWNFYITGMFLQAFRDHADFLDKAGIVEQHRGTLQEMQRLLSKALFMEGAPTAKDLENLTAEAAARSIDHRKKELTKLMLKRVKFPGDEKAASFCKNILIAVPFLAVGFQAMKVDWSPVSTGIALVGSLIICLSYVLALRGLFRAFVSAFPTPANANSNTPFDLGHPMSKGGNRFLLALMALALAAIGVGWVIVDAKFLVWTTAFNAWGDKNPNALQMNEAFGIASVFNGLLFSTSIGYIYLNEMMHWVEEQVERRMHEVRQRLGEVVSHVQAEQASLRRMESDVTQEKEAELHSARVAAWVHMVSIVIDMIQNRGRKNAERDLLDRLRPGCS